ncbi:tetratricopeptide repeat protein [Aquimarina sp. 433]
MKSYKTEHKEILLQEKFAVRNDESYTSDYKINPKNLNAFIAGHQEYFVNECQPYYWYVSAQRAKKLINVRYNVDEKYFKTISKKIRKGKHKKEHLFQRALIYMSRGEFENAKADFYTYQEDDPNDDKITYHLAWACELNGEYGVAKAWYKQMIKKNNHFDAILGHSIVNRKIRDNARLDSVITDITYHNMNQSNEIIKQEDITTDRELDRYPAPTDCQHLKDNEELKKCFSSYFKSFVNSNFDRNVIEYANLKPGWHLILSKFKVSHKGEITDVFVLHDDPFIVNEITRILYAIPTLQTGELQGKSVDVLYGFPFSIFISE